MTTTITVLALVGLAVTLRVVAQFLRAVAAKMREKERPGADVVEAVASLFELVASVLSAPVAAVKGVFQK